jgi:Autophagy protein ATG9
MHHITRIHTHTRTRTHTHAHTHTHTELYHEQSREVAQHRHSLHSRHNLTIPNHEWLIESGRSLRRFANSLYARAQSAHYTPIWSPTSQSTSRPDPTLYLNELGIPKEPLLNNIQVPIESIPEDATVNNMHDNPDFVLLRGFRAWTTPEGWGAAADLDVFFGNLYRYYYHRGLVPLFCKGVVDLLILVFTGWLSVVLFAYVDWGALRTCHDESTCQADFYAHYIRNKPLSFVHIRYYR